MFYSLFDIYYQLVLFNPYFLPVFLDKIRGCKPTPSIIINSYLSTTTAVPIPPPIHRVAIPFLESLFCIS